MHLIVCEKPSAARNFAKALGGMKGSFDGIDYEIVALAGHIMEFNMPADMVSDDKVKKYKSWDITDLPWNINDFSWSKHVAKGKELLLQNVKAAARRADVFVMACDVDPSGEGGMIAGEVAREINWTGPVKRMYFIDESVKQIQKAFKTMKSTSLIQDPEIRKADTRSRWDFLSMQIVRGATTTAQEIGFGVVLRNGRLKSVINRLVFEQEEAVRKYKKTPYFEAQFKDDKGNTYKRKFNEGDSWRFAKKDDVPLGKYHASGVTQDSISRKQSAPPKFYDLMGLASVLTSKGYKSKDVLSTYQNLYQDMIVSYPRTEDKVISVEQFNEMLPLIDRIADVVGVDKSKLTHRTARNTHVKDGGSHGANRPGLKVPTSLQSLAKYDQGSKSGIAAAIYELLAKNFLATFGEDYVYDSISAHVTDYPDFKTTVSVPVDLGYKAIFQEEQDDDNDESSDSTGLGSNADPFIHEGFNPKPPAPSLKWLKKQLEKYEVGTGATRVSTISTMAEDREDRRLLVESKGKLSTTVVGKINAVLIKGTWIADPAITEQLFNHMEEVGNGSRSMESVVNSATKVVIHDVDIIVKNKTLAEKYKETVLAKGGADAKKLAKIQSKARAQRVKLMYGGQEVEISNSIMGSRPATDDELKELSAKGEIVVELYSTKTKKNYQVKIGIHNDPKFGWSFENRGYVDNRPAKISGMFKGQEIEFRPTYGQYQFDKSQINRLLSGDELTIQTTNKNGDAYNATVHLRNDPKYGWGVGPVFKKKGKPTSIADMKPTFSNYVFSDSEKQQLLDGIALLIPVKDKKAFVKFGLTKFKGHEYYGYYVDKWV